MCSRCVQQESPTKLSHKSVAEYWEIVFYQSVPQECRARVSGKSVSQECPIEVSHRSVPQECPQEYAKRVSRKSVLHDCPRRLSSKSVLQRVAFHAIEHLLFAFHCSVRTFLLHELSMSGTVAFFALFKSFFIQMFSILSLILNT